MAGWIERLGRFTWVALRSLFALARPVAWFDKWLARAVLALRPALEAFAAASARAHQGSAQDDALLYLAGLALLLLARLFGS